MLGTPAESQLCPDDGKPDLPLHESEYPTATSARSVAPYVSLEMQDLADVERARPLSLRQFDQIPMTGHHLLRQARLLATMTVGARVLFMGDSDGISLLLGLQSARGGPGPQEIHLADFDERLLSNAQDLASRRGFSSLLHVWRYNVFDKIPSPLTGRCDFFVTNPPYGMRNHGESARLFISRASEMMVRDGAAGAIILPDDVSRPWTIQAMQRTRPFLTLLGWRRRMQLSAFHRYRLDDDPDLASDLIVVERDQERSRFAASPYAGRRVDPNEIPNFYGCGTLLPYPRYVSADGNLDYNWDGEEQAHEWPFPARTSAA